MRIALFAAALVLVALAAVSYAQYGPAEGMLLRACLRR